jgi:hypothetical protein
VKTATTGKLSLAHLQAYEDEIKKAKIVTDRLASVLLPSYTPDEVRKR